MLRKIDASNISFSTDRLLIRGLIFHDLDNFRKYLSFSNKVYSDEEVKEILSKTIDSNDTLGIFRGNELVGALVFATLNNEVDLIQDSKFGTGIGYSVRKDFRNQGIMSEVVEGFINYCFDILQLDFVYGYCGLDNIASYRVLEKCGFTWYKRDDEYNHFVIWREDIMLKKILSLNIYDFFGYIKSIRYGYKDKDGYLHFITDHDFHNYVYAFSSPEEIVENNCGWCWDVAQLIKVYCNENKYEYSMLFSEYLSDDYHQTHTQVFMKFDTMWYQCPDNSSEYEFGTYKFVTKNECINDFKESYIGYIKYELGTEFDENCIYFMEYNLDFESGISESEFLGKFH